MTCPRCNETREEFFLPSTLKRQGRRTRDYCRACHRENSRIRREKYPNYAKEHYQKYKITGAKVRKQAADRYRVKTTQTVFDHYGWLCACCGESNRMFLTIDHINNDGYVLKELAEKRYRLGGTGFYKHIIDNGFPEDLQTLCYNCNFGKNRNKGTCPHKINAIAT